jgi:hypothetical protein
MRGDGYGSGEGSEGDGSGGGSEEGDGGGGSEEGGGGSEEGDGGGGSEEGDGRGVGDGDGDGDAPGVGCGFGDGWGPVPRGGSSPPNVKRVSPPLPAGNSRIGEEPLLPFLPPSPCLLAVVGSFSSCPRASRSIAM